MNPGSMRRDTVNVKTSKLLVEYADEVTALEDVAEGHAGHAEWGEETCANSSRFEGRNK
jgi:hypothetical protein